MIPRPYQRTLVAVAILKSTWKLVHAQEIPLEDTIMIDEDEKNSAPALGGAGMLTSADSLVENRTADALVLVLATRSPTITSTPTQAVVSDEIETMSVSPNVMPTLNSNNATDLKEVATPAQATTPLNAEPNTADVRIKLPTQQPVDNITMPLLRKNDPAKMSDAAMNGAAEKPITGKMIQGSKAIALVAMIAICCIFLLLWRRKRRSSAASSLGALEYSKGSKLRYTQVPDKTPLSNCRVDDAEFCDVDEEDSFANDCSWDDWEGHSTQTQTSQLNPFASASRAPSLTPLRRAHMSACSSNLTQTLSSEVASAGEGQLLPVNVEFDSSIDSFEVLPAEVHVSPTSDRGDVTVSEKEGDSVDDLFSQFGMVPTFKTNAVVNASPADRSVTSAHLVDSGATPLSASSLPTAANASVMFAAEMDDDMNTEDEWGEDDEWVKGI
ncbi:hypothetical protein CCR75_003029 [Bremia lactucae]|uniref:Uncharacterized protein n=1 Tax=Bremia lactucae TaxID=4779 RepID=A0A976IM96_BRELC|nr:hypothetical protein CCR75_003029 [Bremia lactucae]